MLNNKVHKFKKVRMFIYTIIKLPTHANCYLNKYVILFEETPAMGILSLKY